MVKKLLVLFILSLGVSSYAELSLKGKVLDQSIQNIILYKYFGYKSYPFDTIKVKDGSFEKTYASFEKGLYMLGTGAVSEEIVLVEDMNITVTKDLFNMPWKAVSKPNADYFSIRNNCRSYDQKMGDLNTSYNQFAYLAETNPQQFQTNITFLRAKLDSLNTTYMNFFKNGITSSKSQFGKDVCSFMYYNPQEKPLDYFKKDELNNTHLYSGDFLFRKINFLNMKLNQNEQNDLEGLSNALLLKIPSLNRGRELMYEALVSRCIATNREDYASFLFEQYEKEAGKEGFIHDRIQQMIPPPAPKIGQLVPEIEAIDKDGKVFKLSELRGKVVLIDFWASWCGPCRRESPNVVANYLKYKDDGFTILSISADKDRAAWLQAVQHDNYTWPNHLLSQDNGYQAQKDFQVQGYPTMFLVDRDGKLLAFGNSLRGQGLPATLTQVFGK